MTPHRMYEVLVCADDEKGLFLKLVSALQKSSLSVLDARIHTTRDGKALDTFLAMDAGKRPEPQEVFEIASSNILDSLSGRRRCRRYALDRSPAAPSTSRSVLRC